MTDNTPTKDIVLNAQALDDLISELQSIRNTFTPTLNRDTKRELAGKLSTHDLEALVGDKGCLTTIREELLIGRDYW